jgi:hypothetical protein
VNIGRTAVGHELPVHGHVEVADGAVSAEDLAEMGLVDVFGEFLDDDLEHSVVSMVM